jgi:hypothetical protein
VPARIVGNEATKRSGQRCAIRLFLARNGAQAWLPAAVFLRLIARN